MPQYSFGSGTLIGVNTTANSTPVNFGGLQDVTLDFSFNLKELHGQYQFPLAVGRGTGKITGQAKFAQVNGLILNSLFFGLSSTVGQLQTAFHEAGTVPGTPYQITVANAATFVTDYGVINSLTGIPLTKVASAPTTGQYSVSNVGVYTFAAADTTLAMLISYTYTTSASGNKTIISNQLLGTAPTFKIALYETYNSKALTIELNQCIAAKLNFATKLEDFTIPGFDFSAFADASGNLGTISMAE